ncbi:ABC transporter substrate-binding protein [Cellulomonas sp. SG140]|uniref:ABC transporter substrate-binding protein n=1 Tax=Cellulomonas sp. SG140 TaxID=2976536 RepID=UPI0021E7525B|nr:ABC transporter substrate-binding protein [Cellulomonas sp. SG140]
MRRRRGQLIAALVAVAALTVAGCTATTVDPQRSRTVVVTVDVPFESLNAATTAGRTPGSTLVRGLVQDRFTTVDEAGAVVPDTAMGTVEKTSDNPLTVRYTIAPNARWSDGVPVTGDDLLLEWAARSGQLDETPPGTGPGGTETASPAPSSSATVSAAPSTTPAASSTAPAPSSSAPSTAPASDTVWFGAVSPVLVHAPALPTVDEHGLTLVYADPVADWQSALDVNLPAHVVGRLALGGATGATEGPTAGAAASATPGSPSATTATGGSPAATSTAGADAPRWAALVTAAIQHADRNALIPVSRVWRTAADAAALKDDPAAAVTTGPYRLDVVDPGKRVELVRNEAYSGARPAAYDRVVVRSDLDPLAQVAALRAGTADVVAPVATPDVRSALQKLPNVRLSDGGGAVLQLQLQEGGGSVFDPAHWTSSGGDGTARAAALRAAFVGAVDRARLAALAHGSPSGAVLAAVGPTATTSAAAPSQSSSPAPGDTTTSAPPPSATPGGPSATPTGGPSAAAVPVRVLVSTDDEVRRDMLAALTAQLAPAGFAVTQARPADPATALWADPGSWDVALLPVPQSPAPVASVLARWRTGGATNVTAHRDPALDALLDQAARQTDAAAVTESLSAVSAALTAADVVVPLVRQPELAATVGAGTSTASSDGRPRLPQVPAVPWGSADLTSWWRWASTAA